MKILAVMGSPRKNGNTYRVVNQIEQCLKKLGEVEFEYLFLADVKLEMCRGCGLCIQFGDDKCPIKDERKQVEQKLLAADGVIFASAVYALNMTALLKNFLDRFSFTMHRPRFFKQYTLIVSVSAGSGLKETISRMSALKYCGFNIVDSLGVGVFDFELASEKTKDKIQKKITAAANRFYQAVNRKKKYSPTLENLFLFCIQRTAFTLLKDYFPADYVYFAEKGWFDKKRRYYIDAKINPIKEWVAKVIAGLASRNARGDFANLQRRKQ